MSTGIDVQDFWPKALEIVRLAAQWSAEHQALAASLVGVITISLVVLVRSAEAENRARLSAMKWALEQQTAPAPEGLVQSVLHYARSKGCEDKVSRATGEMRSTEGGCSLRVCHVLALIRLIEAGGKDDAR